MHSIKTINITFGLILYLIPFQSCSVARVQPERRFFDTSLIDKPSTHSTFIKEDRPETKMEKETLVFYPLAFYFQMEDILSNFSIIRIAPKCTFSNLLNCLIGIKLLENKM